MAENTSRSQNKSLEEGATDGRYRKSRPNTETIPGQGDELVQRSRASLPPLTGYGYPTSELPAGERLNPGGR